jgi:hypothetical protein
MALKSENIKRTTELNIKLKARADVLVITNSKSNSHVMNQTTVAPPHSL